MTEEHAGITEVMMAVVGSVGLVLQVVAAVTKVCTRNI